MEVVRSAKAALLGAKAQGVVGEERREMKKATGLVLLSVLLAACGCAAPTPDIPVPTYDVVEVDDISLAHSTRLRVVVTTEFPIVTEQIGALCEEVVQDLKSQGPLNAVVVFLYDTRSMVSGAYSIARCEYAPNGVWEDAGKVQAGDYSTHRFAYEYRPKVGDPDAALPERPTEQEHNLCQQWDRLAFELISESDDVAASEALAYEQIAEENGVSTQTVEDAVYKCIFWAFR